MAFDFPSEYADVEQVPDYAAESLEDLLSVFKDQPRIEAFVTAYANRLTELEDATFRAMVLMTDLDAAASEEFGGEWLRRLAVLADQPQEGATNATWAAFIRARMAAHRSRGTERDLINILRLLFGEETAFRADEGYPKGSVLYVLDDLSEVAPDVDPVAAGRLLGDAKDAGTRLHLVYASGHDPELDGLVWSDQADAPESGGWRTGWSSVYGGALLDTELDGVNWSGSATVTGGAEDPLGGFDAYELEDDSAVGIEVWSNIGTIVVEDGGRYRLELYVKKTDPALFPTFAVNRAAPALSAGFRFDTATGAFALAGADTSDRNLEVRAVDDGNWWFLSMTFTAGDDADLNLTINVCPFPDLTTSTPDVTLTGTITVYMPRFSWGGRYQSAVQCRGGR